MDGSRDDYNNNNGDRNRKNLIFKLTGATFCGNARQQALLDIGGLITYKNILSAAVRRSRNKAHPNSKSLFGTWSQHISTIGKVFDEFRLIMDELQLPEDEKQRLGSELNKEYGSGSEGNYMS